MIHIGIGGFFPSQFRTQKALGFAALAEHGFRIPTPSYVLQSEEDVEAFIETVGFYNKPFVRPCPVTPRHGFVDSRKVSNEVGLRKVWKEMKEEDPNGELLILPTIAAKYNFIFTPTQVAVGPGHDGATAGKNSLSLPLASFSVDRHADGSILLSGANVKDSPFFEAVQGNEYDQVYFTQLRNGPRLPATRDYIPFSVAVEDVVTVNDNMSLLEWETLVKAMREGCVVYHPNGNLASHFAVHCVTAGIPYITTAKPELGDVLSPTGETKYSEEEIRIGVGMAYATSLNSDDVHSVTTAAFSFLHNATVLSGENSRLVGFGAGILHRLAIAALLGELRHARGNRRKQERNAIYTWALKNQWTARRKLYRAAKGFATYSWSSGYGGLAWAQVADSTFHLDTAIKNLFKQREGAVQEILNSLNVLVNTMHNGGRSLNKFIGENTMDDCAKNYVGVLNHYAEWGYQILSTLSRSRKWEEQWEKARQLRVKLRFETEPSRYQEVYICKPEMGTSYGRVITVYKNSADEIKRKENSFYHPSAHDRMITGDVEVPEFSPVKGIKLEKNNYGNKLRWEFEDVIILEESLKQSVVWGE